VSEAGIVEMNNLQ